MKYLSGEEILFVHSAIIDESGGVHGVRDLNLIMSLELLPRQSIGGQELYPSIFLKAAVYARNIMTSHPFIDGNKRTSLTAAIVFLERNNYAFKGKEGSVEDFALRIVKNRLSLETIARWLETHSKKKK
ncbi:MAG: type II toxin-antitoxin system death-on-curing family toxin [bacterium]|nr:type II toxin-antitoxin system death-on-curing family toxin [bacterium]